MLPHLSVLFLGKPQVTQVQLGAIKNGSALEELSADTMDDDAASLAEVDLGRGWEKRCRWEKV